MRLESGHPGLGRLPVREPRVAILRNSWTGASLLPVARRVRARLVPRHGVPAANPHQSVDSIRAATRGRVTLLAGPLSCREVCEAGLRQQTMLDRIADIENEPVSPVIKCISK